MRWKHRFIGLPGRGMGGYSTNKQLFVFFFFLAKQRNFLYRNFSKDKDKANISLSVYPPDWLKSCILFCDMENALENWQLDVYDIDWRNCGHFSSAYCWMYFMAKTLYALYIEYWIVTTLPAKSLNLPNDFHANLPNHFHVCLNWELNNFPAKISEKQFQDKESFFSHIAWNFRSGKFCLKMR